MRNILLIVFNMLKVTFRKKSNIIVYIILPVVINAGLIGTFGNDKSSKVRMGVVNKDNTVISINMISYLDGTGKFDMQNVDEVDVDEKISSRKLDFALIIPENFGESVYNGKPEILKIVSIKGIEVTAWIENYSNLYIKNLMDIYNASKGNKQVFEEIYNGYNNGNFRITTEAIKDKSMNKVITRTSIGMLLFFILIACSTTANLILKEKRERTYHRICSSPISNRGYVFSNIIVNIFITFIQIVMVLFFMKKIFNIETYVPTMQMIVILMSFGLAAVGIGMLIMVFSNSTSASGTITSLVATPTCMLSGCFWPKNFMPNFLQKFSDFIPQTWAMDAINKIQTGKSFSQIRINIFILLGFASVFFLVAVYKMKKSNNVEKFI